MTPSLSSELQCFHNPHVMFWCLIIHSVPSATPCPLSVWLVICTQECCEQLHGYSLSYFCLVA